MLQATSSLFAIYQLFTWGSADVVLADAYKVLIYCWNLLLVDVGEGRTCGFSLCTEHMSLSVVAIA